jgi:aminomethyltransferase
MSQASPRKTPLCDEHIRLGAKMVDFAGWSMPVQYIGLKEEHLNVRKHVGLFDVSHMGEIRVKGPKALETLEWLTTNDVSKLEKNEAQYNLLPNEQGGLVDDIYVYCLEKNADYLVCVNAANTDKDWAWFQKNNRGADITDESSRWAQIAVQGPKAPQLMEQVTGLKVTEMKRNQVSRGHFQGAEIIVASTGYTGEKGGEIFVETSGAVALWRALLEKGKALNVMAIGLGARDTLRTEMKFSLYGHEIDDQSNPFEAGLGWVVKPAKKDFIGKAAMMAVKEKGPKQALVGFKMIEKGIPRQGYDLYSPAGEKIGRTASGTLSPCLDVGIGIGYVAAPYASVGTEILVDIRGRKIKAQVCPTPFVQV